MRVFRQFSFSVIIYFLGLSLLGLCFMPLLPVKEKPTKSLPGISVTFTIRGRSPRVVESQVTTALEAALSRINGITGTESVSDEGQGKVVLHFNKGTDMDAARFEVTTLIRQLWPQLPNGMGYPSVSVWRSESKADSPFLTYTLHSPETPSATGRFAEEHLRPLLMQINGISSVNISGYEALATILSYDADEWERYGITPADIHKPISDQLSSSFLGFAETRSTSEREQVPIYLHPQDGMPDIENLPVHITGGRLFRLGDLVRIENGENVEHGAFRINGQSAVSISIYANDGANQITLGKRVKRQMETFAQKLPKGFQLLLDNDASECISGEVQDVAWRSVAAFLIILAFVFLTSRNTRYLFCITAALAASLAVAFIFYYLLGVEIHLYSVAGIAISFGMVIDNIIVMADHLLYRGKLNIFIAILAATLTTIASLSVVFLLDEQIRLNLADFSWILIINLNVSLAVSLFLVPALLEKAKVQTVTVSTFHHRRRVAIWNQRYASILRFALRRRWLFFVLMVLLFGTPLFLLPRSVQGDSFWARHYNDFHEQQWVNTLRTYSDKWLGGTLRLFVQRAAKEKFEMERGETELYVRANLPAGTTAEEADATIRRMENLIGRTEGVQQFRTNVSPQYATITMTFTPDGLQQDIPVLLNDALRREAIQTGNATWYITGVGDSFSNHLNTENRDYCVDLSGYNYDLLTNYAQQLKEALEAHPRVREVQILPGDGGRTDYMEYVLRPDKERLAANRFALTDVYAAMGQDLSGDTRLGTYTTDDGTTKDIVLRPQENKAVDPWAFSHSFVSVGGRQAKVSEWLKIDREQTPQHITKTDQEYRLRVEYNYLGDRQLGEEVLKNTVDSLSAKLPAGYKAVNPLDRRAIVHTSKFSPYWSVALVVLIIYLICAILFNSFTQPFIIIFTIPVSYIGIFVSHALLDIPFNQGGIGAFVLLGGLTCNSAIYLMNDYNAFRRRDWSKRRAYLRAFDGKIVPILMTLLSTALGFVPFMLGTGQDAFWFSLSVGTVCGLSVSLLALVLYVPLMLGHGKDF